MKKVGDKYEISHLGETFKTIHFKDVSDESCDVIRKQYFEKPDIDVVNKQFLKIKNGGTVNNHINKYYFFDLMCEAKLSTGKWSIKEFFECNDLIRFTVGKVTNCSNFYDSNTPLIKNIATVLRLSPSGTAPKLSNYPLKSVDQVLEKYNMNNKYYDYSCGWGIRLLGSLKASVDYYGTDPNYKLVSRLNQMGEDYNSLTGNKSTFDIKPHGSEVFVPEWENTIGLAFSSPPYFDLEDYKTGEQSINNKTYKEWLKEYWYETLRNIKAYLIVNGYLLLNIKNIKEHSLLDDMKKLCEISGFEYIESLELKNINRVILANNGKHTNEEILVFKKKYESASNLFNNTFKS